MKYTPEEVIQFVQEENVRFIRLAFCNVYGKQHNVAIMPSELERAFASGIAFDASAVEGFGGEIRSDLLLHPDPSTLIQLPWRPEQGKAVRMFCVRRWSSTSFDLTNTATPPGFPMTGRATWTLRRTTKARRSEGRSA